MPAAIPLLDHRVAAWLTTHETAIIDLPSLVRRTLPDGALIDKVGMLPVWFQQGVLHVRLAKPFAKKGELGDPGFQLPKGTRQFFDKAAGAWRDMGRGHDPQSWDNVLLETLPHAALREGMEEVGIIPANLTRVWEIGPIAVKSASTGTEKFVYMYAAEVADPAAFTAPDGAHASAGNVQWFSIGPDFVAADAISPAHPIRPDHAVFLCALRDVLASVR